MRRKFDSIKAHLPSKSTMNTALSSLQMSLDVFKEVAGKTPVPGLQEAVKALVIVLDVIRVRRYPHRDSVIY
jgi:hypothetical protein